MSSLLMEGTFLLIGLTNLTRAKLEPGCSFPSMSTSEGVERANSSLIRCKLGSTGADVKELQVMRLQDHPNVVRLRHSFFSTTDKDELYLNLVLEYVPETVYRASKHYTKQHMPIIQKS